VLTPAETELLLDRCTDMMAKDQKPMALWSAMGEAIVGVLTNCSRGARLSMAGRIFSKAAHHVGIMSRKLACKTFGFEIGHNTWKAGKSIP